MMGNAPIDRPSPADRFSIFAVNIDSGERRRVTTPPPGGGDWRPAVSPDGQQVAFVRAENVVASDLHVTGINGEGPRRLTFERRHVGTMTRRAKASIRATRTATCLTSAARRMGSRFRQAS